MTLTRSPREGLTRGTQQGAESPHGAVFPAQGARRARRARLHFSAGGVKRFCGEAGDKYLLDWRGVKAPRTPIEQFFYNAARPGLERDDADGLGVNKHHEFWFHFAPARRATQGQEYGRLVAAPPLALATGEWNCSTDVFGPLAARPNIHLVAPAAYPEFVWLMDRATVILTDSGGVQEEAPSLRKPVLVMRDTTERPEAVEAGAVELVGTRYETIVDRVFLPRWIIFVPVSACCLRLVTATE